MRISGGGGASSRSFGRGSGGPDLYEKIEFTTKADQKLLKELDSEEIG